MRILRLIDKIGLTQKPCFRHNPHSLEPQVFTEGLMPIDHNRIAQMEADLARARSQLLQEDGERFSIIMRYITEEEKQRILGSLTDKREKILFSLEVPDERRTGGIQPGRSGGNLTCDICQKSGLTTRGLALHKSRVHGIKPGSAAAQSQPPYGSEQTESSEATSESTDAEAAETGEEGSRSRRRGMFGRSAGE
jgi:hypothetical protein